MGWAEDPLDRWALDTSAKEVSEGKCVGFLPEVGGGVGAF